MEEGKKHSADELNESIKELIATNKALVKGSPLWKTFITGAVGAIGATVGAAIVITILAAALHQLAAFNWLRPAVDRVLPYVEKPSPTPTSSYYSQ